MTQTADLIFINARIFTSDDSNPHTQAVAVKGNRILYVGDNTGAEEFRGEKTRLIDGQGRMLTPGFIDTHVHLLWGSIWLGNAQLQNVRK
jgi:predicted amidohydrolase YtcJ